LSRTDIIFAFTVRSAIGGYNGTLTDTSARELDTIAIAETLRRSGLSGDDIDTVVMGSVVQAGNRMNPVRQAAIGVDLPVSMPAVQRQQ